ncbi:MAG: TIGR00730 family Rossman fold protein [Dehalococcoidales bacterium]|nr:TIGR00730 family Rossman fold protein [Dehalococcoidales bacterium]
MTDGYEINDLAKEESWRIFRYIGEMVEGFDELSGIEPAVTIYGSARIKPGDGIYAKTVEIAQRLGELGFSIVTGGGPGIMEAANKGAAEAGVKSVGLNIELPVEQVCNAYANKTVHFKHFFLRKLMLVKYAIAFVIMPGGMGTMDELTEVLTLIQTHKIKPFPVILYDSQFWKGFLEWMRGTVLTRSYVSAEDFDLLRICDDPASVVETVQKWYIKQELIGRRAITHQ